MNLQDPASKPLRDLLHSEAFSGVVAVTYQGKNRLEFAGGLANRSSGQVNQLGTRFATASVSKMFTAVCLARMVDAGVCRFNQSLVEILPALQSHFNSDHSLASLLSHRSGLGDYLDDDAELPFAGMDVARLDHTPAFLPHVLRVSRHRPGEFRYSSAGYILLGLAIEALSGESYPAAVSRWVCAPAGLHATGFPALDELDDTMAVGYLPDGQSNVGHLPRFGGPDGGIVTNVEDLQRFFRALTRGTFLSETSRQFLWQPVSGLGKSSAYGHGFDLLNFNDQWWYGHTGSDPGVSARVATSADGESSIIVLCNVGSIAFQIFRLVIATALI